MRRITAYSHPADVEIIEEGGRVHYKASFREVIQTGEAESVLEAGKEIFNFLVLWSELEYCSKGIACDIAEMIADEIAKEINQDPKEIYFEIVS